MTNGGAVYRAVRDALRDESPLAWCTVVRVDEGVDAGTTGSQVRPGARMAVLPGRDPVGTLGDEELDRVVARDAEGLLAQGLTELRHYGEHGEARPGRVEVFVESFAPRPRLLLFGAVDFTRALVQVGSVLGYRTTVCDPRAPFATAERFPEADEVVVDWPHRHLERAPVDERTVICVLTHDPKMDVPALVAAVRTRAGYIGAMGSRRTTAERLVRLREAGLGPADLARISAPIGLDLGARTPEETALAILAEVVALRSGRTGGRLTDTSGPIHA